MAGRSPDSNPKSPRAPEKRLEKGAAAKPPASEQPATEPAPPPRADPSPRSPRRIALDRAFRSRDDLRQGLTEHLSESRRRNDAMDARVDKAFTGFDPAAPPVARRQYLAPGATPTEALTQAMGQRLDTLKKDATAFRIAVSTKSPAIEWASNGDSDGQPQSGAIELAKLMHALNEGMAVTAAPRSVVAACQAEQMAQAILDTIDGTAKAGGDVPGEATPSDSAGGNGARPREKVAEFVARSVDGQMSSATAPEDKLTYGLIPNGADADPAQASLLDTFQLRPGPTDVTAYHDFSTLQIAFEDTWTRVFDGELEALGREIYREYVGLKDFLGYDPDTADPPISSLDDLTWLIGEIRMLSQVAQDGLPTGARSPVPVGTGNIPQGANDIGKAAEEFVESLPGGRVLTAISTLGISELVLLAINEIGSLGRKTALLWDDLINGRPLQRNDRIFGSVDNNVIAPGNFDLVLRTDISNMKEVAFQTLDQGSQKFVNRYKVSNSDKYRQILTNSAGQPDFYVHQALIPTNLLPGGILEFASQEGLHMSGRYVLGDLDKIVSDGGRLTLYWKDA